MVGRVLSLPSLLTLLGCASPLSNVNRDDSIAQLAPKKEKRCVEEYIVGSHLPYLICEGDAPPANVSKMDQQELRDRITRSVSPSRGN